MTEGPRPSKGGTTRMVLKSLTPKPRQKPGLACRICAIFARQLTLGKGLRRAAPPNSESYTLNPKF